MRGWVELDGSSGEGGGQILRTALALSLITGKGFHLFGIRQNRDVPGLRAQHLTAVLAACEVGQTEVGRMGVGSKEISFSPGKILANNYHFSVGTAGSAVLVLQTLLPALCLAEGPSSVVVEGGTYNPNAPSFDFLKKAYLPLLNRMGPQVSVKLVRPGFYPSGGGLIRAEITPALALNPIRLGLRTKRDICARALVVNLPLGIAERELTTIGRLIDVPFANRYAERLKGPSPGNVVFIEVDTGEVTEVFTGIGERGVRAEEVAEQAVSQAKPFLDSEACVGGYLTDQILPLLALSGSGSFLASEISSHTLSNMQVIRSFLGSECKVRSEGKAFEVSL